MDIDKIKLALIVGTRPEIIKMYPIYLELLNSNYLNFDVILSGQHPELAESTLKSLKFKVNHISTNWPKNSSLNQNLSLGIKQSDKILKKLAPHGVLIQGDTTTAVAYALSAYNLRIPVFHVEAGLRSFNKNNPFPEEVNRLIISRLSNLHFCPTELSKINLLKEGIDEKDIYVTGNTIVDMLRISNPSRLKVNNINLFQIIITIHRRENFAKIHELLKTIIMTANLFPDLYFTFVVHPNPVIAKSIKKVSIPPKNLKFVAPMEYIDFIEILNSSRLVITDSGGLQEECMTLGIPTLVFRETTERPEGLSPDHVQLWDGSFEILKNKILKLKESELILKKYSDLNRYFGNGKSAAAIIKIVEEYFHVQ